MPVDMEGRADYLRDLRGHLLAGVERLPERFLARHVRWVRDIQEAAGGFPGPGGGSDLYYTSFGLRCADLLGMDDPRLWARAAIWLAESARGACDLVDCFCVLQSAGMLGVRGIPIELPLERIGPLVASCRAEPGAYARSRGALATLYHPFLACQCLTWLGQPLPCADHLAAFVKVRRRPDGGYADVAAAGGGSAVSPTAAEWRSWR